MDLGFRHAAEVTRSRLLVVPGPSTPLAVDLPPVFGRDDLPPADAPFPRVNAADDLVVDELSDVVLLPRHVILDGSAANVVSSSFKKTPRQRHFGLVHHGDRRYSPVQDHDLSAARQVDEPVYYLDCEFPDVYGHHLLEVWPQTWALPLLGRDDLWFATSVRLRPYVLQVLAHLGVPADRILPVAEPVRCRTLLVPTPAVRARRYVHPVCTEVFARIAELGDDPAARRAARRYGPALYLSRRRVGDRSMTNEAEIEAIAVRAGLQVFHPQEHDLATQLAVYARTSCLVGPGGSAMHNAVFCRPSARALLLSSTSWFTVIDPLLAQGRYQVGYVFGDPDDPASRGRRGKGSYSVDPEAFRTALDTFLVRRVDGPAARWARLRQRARSARAGAGVPPAPD